MADLKRFSYSTYCAMATDFEYPVDQTAVLLNLHISTEYWLDQLIQHRCTLSDGELEAFDLSYAKKLGILKALQLLPEEMSRNLRALNELRNRFAHRLDYVLGMTDADFTFTTSSISLESYKGQSSSREGFNWQNMLADIGKATLKPLEQYCLKEVGLPAPDDGQD